MKSARVARRRKPADDRPRVGLDAPRIEVNQRPPVGPGNQALQRSLRAGAVLARDTATDLPPGLPSRQAQEARRLLGTNPQGAVDAVVAGMSARGRIESTYFENGRVVYDTEAELPGGHFGRASLTPGSGLPRPIRVVVGADALRTLGVLYQTIAHEYRHVLELRSGATSEAGGEIDAYIAETTALETSGAWRDMRYLNHLNAALRHWWSRLTEHEQLARREAYTAALEAWRVANERRLDEQFRAQTGR